MTKIAFLDGFASSSGSSKCAAMLSSRKVRISSAFDRANGYDTHAIVQRDVVGRLAGRIATLPIDPTMPALEIGCGTGFLTQRLLESWPNIPLTISDIAPAMLDRARRTIGERPNISYACIDGEQLDIAAGSLGLIASSLAFQWFETPAASVARMIETLKPGGWLAFSTLVSGSFREWAEAQDKAGATGLTRSYPETSVYQQIASDNCDVEIERYTLTETHPDGLRFLQGLRSIGAGARWDGAPPSTVGLRRAIRLFEQHGARISYEIAQVVMRRVK